MVTQRGIEANPDKIKAILHMRPPNNINEVQRLTGRIAALSRFISKSAEKGLRFFKTLRKVKNFEWTKECQQAFEDLKAYLAKLPLLVKPVPGDTLYLYISSTPQAFSSVLVREEEGNQTPIYYVSKVLNGAESRYPPIEKMALALIITDNYQGPGLGGLRVRDDRNNPEISPRSETLATSHRWLSSTAQGSGAGIVLTTPQGDDMEFAVKFEFKASNNEAEYEVLVLGVRMAQEAGASHLLAYSDFQQVVRQVNGEYKAKEESMVQYLQQIEELEIKFKSFQLHQIPREENIKADSLSKLASALGIDGRPRIPLAIQPISSSNNDWRTPIIRWIEEGHLLGDRWEATKIKNRAIRFLMQGGMLYKKSFTHPLLRCLSQEEGIHVIKEIHDGCCGSHVGTWVLANKALRASYF
ncbi:UNVERIFIED_CONTAM: hypothetical protein Sradi_4007400 [Sesamum radiatum]|uniref:RNase H type-1 domain-containing protein n=1 Tax=Sesamum radiatum TaxID=300843 RepID=A0AAW2PH51_SESRA